MFRAKKMLTEYEFQLLNLIQEIRTPFLDGAMKLFSFLGSTAIIWILFALILTVNKKSRKNGIVIGLAMILGLIAGGLILKHIFLRVRPFNDSLGLLSAKDLIISIPSDRFSFPSSHAVTSFAAATGIFLWDKRFGIASYILAALVAFSRLYLYVHFPADVLFGSILGIVCGIAAQKLMHKTHR